MHKFLSLFFTWIITFSIINNIISCKPDKGNMISIYYYNTGEFNNLKINGKSFYENENYNNEIYENILNNSISIPNNIIMPLIYGLNLTKDNNLGIKGGKWTKNQITNSLQAKKNEIINTSPKKQKKIWINFYNNYSTTDDSYYTQIGLTKQNNIKIYDMQTNRILLPTSNYTKILNKKNVQQNIIPEFNLTIKNTLNVLPPIKKVIDWLNNPINNYNTQYNDFNEPLLLQSIRYILLEMPEIIFTFEFINKNKIFIFDVIVSHITAKIEYLTYKNPHNDNKHIFGHQWFFKNYDFFDISKYKNDNYHLYTNIWISPKIPYTKFAIGFVNYNQPFTTLTKDKIKKLKRNVGKFQHNDKIKFTIPELKWIIKNDSIKELNN